MKESIKILLVDDHEVVRLGLRTLFSRYQSLKVVDEAGSGKEAIDKAALHRPDVVIMDLRLPGQDGVEAIRKITQKSAASRVLVLTAFSDDELLFEAIAAGASGYLLKEIDSERLVHAVERVARGESLLDPLVTERVLKRVREGKEKRENQPFGELTWQQKRILALIAEGKSNREIGALLDLSEKTIRNYVSRILSTLGAHSRTQAAAYAIRHHLEVSLPSHKTR